MVSNPITDLLYFGKLPSRGDFVRSAQHPALIQNLDTWQSQVMERLSVDPRWKLVYDAAPTVQFAILGSGAAAGLAGHWLASQDASGRRFPFVTAAVFETDAPRDFMPVSPLGLSRLWARLEQVSRVAHAATELAHAQGSLAAPLEMDIQVRTAHAALADFLDMQTVASLEQMLAAAGTRISLRQATLALGLLLQPAMSQGSSRLNKLLCLPLVHDPAMRGAVASYWLHLILGFFRRHALELGVFLSTVDGRPHLMLGFQGASAWALHAIVDPPLLAEQGVFLNEVEWVEDEVGSDYGLRKLSNYMRDPGLPLSQVLQTYNEVFMGV
jgi:type VI secretion system protein ImpM